MCLRSGNGSSSSFSPLQVVARVLKQHSVGLLLRVPASSTVCNTCLELMARGKGGGRAPRSKQAAEVRLCNSLLISSPRSGAAEGRLPGWPGQADILLQQV